MAYTVDQVFPSENDVGGVDKGRVWRESTFREFLCEPFAAGGPTFHGLNWVRTGFGVQGVTGLDLTMTGGEAVIDGAAVECSGTEDVTLPDDTVNWVWLQLTVDGNNLITGAQIVVTNAVQAFPDRAVFLRLMRTASGAVDLSADRRARSPVAVSQTYTGDAAGSQLITIGHRPTFVIANSTGAFGFVHNVGTPFSSSGSGSIATDTSGFIVGGDLNSNGTTYSFTALGAIAGS